MFISITITSLALFFTIIIFVSNTFVRRNKHLNPFVLFITRIELNFILPLIFLFMQIFKLKNYNINGFYIRLNNIIVKSSNKKYSPSEILILLPHCLQHSSCTYRITNSISNCKKCFKCNIADIRETAERLHISAVNVVTGGNSARTIVMKVKPKLIIAVACERDLASGISDVKPIPTIGFLNKRPNGPCVDTILSMQEFNDGLKSLIKV